MIYALIIFALTLAVDIWTDIRLWMHEKPVHHGRGALLRLIGIVPAAVLFWPVVFLLPLYLVLFNGILSSLKGHGWFYIGEVAKTDRFIRAHPWVYFLIYGLAAAGIAFFISKALSCSLQ